MTSMTRSELIETLALRQTNLNPNVIEEAVKKTFELMITSLESGSRIEVRGFGSFSLRFRLPRVARNPKTGEHVVTEGKYALHFKPGKELRDRVNESAGQARVEEELVETA